MIHLLLGLIPLEIPLPDPAPLAPPGFATPASNLLAAAKWGGLVMLIIGIVLTAATMWTDRRNNNDHMEKFGKIFLGVMLISGAASLVGWVWG